MAYKIRKANFYLALCPNFFVTIYNYNIGKMKFGITVEPESKTNELLDKNKPVIFYGVTISAAAKVLGFNNYCPYGC